MQNWNASFFVFGFCFVLFSPCLFQMDFIAGCFHDGFMLYAKALSEALADGASQNDGVGVITRMQNRRIWGAFGFNPSALTLNTVF